MHILRRSPWGSMDMKQNKLKVYAACRNYELDSCIPVSRLTMNCSVMNLRESQALCTPSHENGGTPQAFCTRMMRIGDLRRLLALFVHPTHGKRGTSQAACMLSMSSPTVSGCLHFLCAPLPNIAGRLRRLACPRYAHAEKCPQSQALCARAHENCRIDRKSVV